MVRCSLWRFICGRIMMKYKTANIAISGKKLIRPDWEADVAFCANAEEIKGTCNLHWDKMRCFAQPRCSAQRPLPTRLCETPENNRGILASPLNSACAALEISSSSFPDAAAICRRWCAPARRNNGRRASRPSFRIARMRRGWLLPRRSASERSSLRRAHTRASFEAALMEAIDALAADFIVLAGFMRILTPAFVARYAQRILNIHPSLLPSFPGLNTHQRALEAGVQLHGATVHFVTPRLDDGPIIAQAAVPVMATDDAGTLAARVLEAEHQLYPRALRWCVEGRLSVQNARALLTPPEPQWLIFDGNAPLV